MRPRRPRQRPPPLPNNPVDRANTDGRRDTAAGECAGLLWHDFASFALRSFRELNPRTRFAMNWHFELIAGKLAAVREGRIRRLIISVPPRHLKSHLASVASRARRTAFRTEH